MQRKRAIEALAAVRGNALCVAIMQSEAPWHDAGQADERYLDVAGCMGGAAAVGLGLALAQPSHKVLVLDGDGSLLMQLGSLVTIADSQPANFFHVVFANGVHQSTGNQRLPAQGTFDFCQLALAAGYRRAVSLDSDTDLEQQLSALLAEEGPTLIRLAIDVEQNAVRWPQGSMAEQVQQMRTALQAQ
jgi:thiamine pyrophosphate-dependent acetolactate synthase large subunit-like protein